MRQVVSDAQLPSAATLGSLQFSIAGIIGPVLGGLLVLLAGANFVFALNAACFLLFVVAAPPWKQPTLPAKAIDDGVLRDPTTKAQFAGNGFPDRITADGRAMANTFRSMIELASKYSDSATANNATYQLFNPFEQRQDIIRIDWQTTGKQRTLRPLPARRVRPARSVRRLLGCAAADRADQPVAAGHRLSGRPHLGRVARTSINEARVSASWNGQRINPRRGHVATIDLRLSVRRTLSRRLHRRRDADGARQRLPQPGRTVVRAALADDRHHVPGHADVHARKAFDPQGPRDLAQPQGSERPRRVSRRRRLSTHRAIPTARATRWRMRCSATSDLQRGLCGSGRLLPFHLVSGVRLRHLAPAAELEPRVGRALRVRAADLRAGQQPRELRSGSLRSGRRRSPCCPTACSSPNSRQPFQRADRRGRRRARGSAGARAVA